MRFGKCPSKNAASLYLGNNKSIFFKKYAEGRSRTDMILLSVDFEGYALNLKKYFQDIGNSYIIRITIRVTFYD